MGRVLATVSIRSVNSGGDGPTHPHSQLAATTLAVAVWWQLFRPTHVFLTEELSPSPLTLNCGII